MKAISNALKGVSYHNPQLGESLYELCRRATSRHIDRPDEILNPERDVIAWPARLPACLPARLPACSPVCLPACPPARLPVSCLHYSCKAT